jgi:threonylcarbamoyladenosine tRNA methylthiotransferase MtaB
MNRPEKMPRTSHALSESVETVNFGCRLNAYESEIMRAHARAQALEDTVIVNTCAVTAEAVRQAKQTIRRLKRERPDRHIIVTGCAAQISPGSFAAMTEVDAVLGNEEKRQAHHFSPTLFTSEETRVRVNDIMSVRETAGHMLTGFAERARAFVEIQNGCDHRCTFCIIPFGRGPSRSVPAGNIVAQIRTLVENGYVEVVLTGVDITAWGADLPGAPRLGSLVEKILRLVPGLTRLRLSSLDAVEIDETLEHLIGENERLMPHLHLSLQAGDDMILKRMKRRHSRADAIGFCRRLRTARADMAFGADIIVGFPTETEDMFAASLSLVEECGLNFLHVFPFSPRPGTPAARMPQLARGVIKERARRLRQKGAKALEDYLDSLVGKTANVLCENGETGHTESFAPVRMQDEGMHADSPSRAGAVVPTRLLARNGHCLLGRGLQAA